MCLMQSAQFLTPRNEIGHGHPCFLFHVGFPNGTLPFITASAKNSAMLKYTLSMGIPQNLTMKLGIT